MKYSGSLCTICIKHTEKYKDQCPFPKERDNILSLKKDCNAFEKDRSIYRLIQEDYEHERNTLFYEQGYTRL